MHEDIVLYEINRNLLSYFPQDSTIQIQDLTWDKVGYKIKVWFTQSDSSWNVVDAIKYKDDVQF